jgi:methanogenic corrinoid protein MtbC1
VPAATEGIVADVLRRLGAFDVAGVSRLLGDAVVGLGLRRALHEVVLPLVNEVGARWKNGALSIAEEHVLTAVLRELLAALMRGRVAQGAPIVLATPAGEGHDIGLLLVALLARDLAVPVVYLGIDLPAEDILATVERTRARALGLAVVLDENREQAVREVQTIQAGLPHGVRLWLGGADAPHVAAALKPFRGAVVASLDAAEAELARLAQPGAPRP